MQSYALVLGNALIKIIHMVSVHPIWRLDFVVVHNPPVPYSLCCALPACDGCDGWCSQCCSVCGPAPYLPHTTAGRIIPFSMSLPVDFKIVSELLHKHLEIPFHNNS